MATPPSSPLSCYGTDRKSLWPLGTQEASARVGAQKRRPGATAIHLKIKRMGYKQDGSFYSAHSLAQALGIDARAVTRWIINGYLKARLRGTARTEAQNGDV